MKADIFLRAPELTPKVVKATNNPLLVPTGHLTSLIEYNNIIPGFQLYLRTPLIESYTETELESFKRQMTSFYYHDQNPSKCCFLVQIRAFVT